MGFSTSDVVMLDEPIRRKLAVSYGVLDILVAQIVSGEVVGRIFKVHAAPAGSPWMWTLAFGHHEDRTPTQLRRDPRGGDGGVCQKLAAGMSKERRTYLPRIVGDKVMLPADLKRLHKYMLDIERIDHISDEMRAVVESEWPELAHKLPPKTPRG